MHRIKTSCRCWIFKLHSRHLFLFLFHFLFLFLFLFLFSLSVSVCLSLSFGALCVHGRSSSIFAHAPSETSVNNLPTSLHVCIILMSLESLAPFRDPPRFRCRGGCSVYSHSSRSGTCYRINLSAPTYRAREAIVRFIVHFSRCLRQVFRITSHTVRLRNKHTNCAAPAASCADTANYTQRATQTPQKTQITRIKRRPMLPVNPIGISGI